MKAHRRPSKWSILIVVVGLVVLASGGIVWWKCFATADQHFQSDTERFEYGSLGGELVMGIPYPIFMILPRIFPDLVEKYAKAGYGRDKEGYGGYAAFGLAWEPGQRLPVGLSIKRVGLERVTVNCAFCHTARYRFGPEKNAQFAVGGPAHTADLGALLAFLFAASHDYRFTAMRIMPELFLQFPLDGIDWVFYSWIWIPETRWKLQFAERQMQWAAEKPAWGPGRDDPFNLPRHLLLQAPPDAAVGATDFPALWRLGERGAGLFHTAGEANSLYPVIATSAFGIGSLPDAEFQTRNKWLETFLNDIKPPPFPSSQDPLLRHRGAEIFADQCASCHAPGGARTGQPIAQDEIGTDPGRLATWKKPDADRMNELTSRLGMQGAGLQAAQGYVARPLVGLWLLAPYLHNGSVPTLWDLLSPPDKRPSYFYRGSDLVDSEKVGFVNAQDTGFRFDTTLPGNSNAGHAYGTTLSDEDKRALIEYLKSL